MRNFQAFKSRYGVFVSQYGVGGRQFFKLESYRNMQELSNSLHEIGMFAEYVPTEKPVHLPPIRFDLTTIEAKAYSLAKNEALLMLHSGELELTSAMAVMHKLRQISSGFVLDEAKVAHKLEDGLCSRQSRLQDFLEDMPRNEQIIFWGHYRQELVDIQEVLTKFYGKDCFVRFDGTQSERHEKKQAFIAGSKQHFVAETSAAGEGLTLINSAMMIYYSNPQSTIQRVQSEARISRQGQIRQPRYGDLCGNGTLDFAIRANHETKKKLSSSLHGQVPSDDDPVTLLSHHLAE
jgi:SNF2 family DNA or RNA helicase